MSIQTLLAASAVLGSLFYLVRRAQREHRARAAQRSACARCFAQRAKEAGNTQVNPPGIAVRPPGTASTAR
jgi:hypothetical protein